MTDFAGMRSDQAYTPGGNPWQCDNDRHCIECGCNLANARNAFEQPCDSAERAGIDLCSGCCNGDECDACGEALDTHVRSWNARGAA